MLNIKNSFFYTGKIKETATKGIKYMSLCHVDKNDDQKIKTYYRLWLTDKVSNLVTAELKKKMVNESVLLIITGYLKIETGEYTNMTIFPTEIKEYIRSNNNISSSSNNYDNNMPF